MKNKFNFLVKSSLKRKVDTKWFKIINVILCIVFVVVLNIDTVIKSFGGNFFNETKVYIIDNIDGTVYDEFKSQINNSISLLNFGKEESFELVSYDKSLEDAKEEVNNSDDEIIVFEFNKSDESVIQVNMVAKDSVNFNDMVVFNTAINNIKVGYSLDKYNLSKEDLNDIYEAVEINKMYLNEDSTSSDDTDLIILGSYLVLIVPVFMLTLMLVQMVGAEINDEKTTKSMEIIISNVSPEAHLASKVVASNLFVLIQTILLFSFAVIGLGVRFLINGVPNIVNNANNLANSTDIMSITNSLSFVDGISLPTNLGYAIPVIIILILVTFFAYSVLAGVLASVTTNTEDFQQLQSPIMAILLIGFYLSILADMFNGSLFIRIISYIPFISSILSPSLFLLGDVGIGDMIISLVLLIIFIVLLIKYGIRIYKVGILNYSSKGLWKKMFNAMKEK